MTRSLILHQSARIEYDAAGDWHEEQRSGLGVAFTAAVQRVFERIAVQPKMHGIVLRDIRKAVVKGFPYCIYYRERSDAIVVLSVFHTSRNPRIWQLRDST